MDWCQSRGVKDAAPLGTSLSPTQSLHHTWQLLKRRCRCRRSRSTAQRNQICWNNANSPVLPVSIRENGPINVVGLEFMEFMVMESLESLMTHERFDFCSNIFKLPFSVSTQSYFQIISATPMTTPQAFRSTPIEIILYNNLLNFFVLGNWVPRAI